MRWALVLVFMRATMFVRVVSWEICLVNSLESFSRSVSFSFLQGQSVPKWMILNTVAEEQDEIDRR